MAKPARLKSISDFLARVPLRYRGTVVAMIPLIGLMATLTTWAWTRTQARTINDWIDHTQSVITASDRLLITAINAETGVRGYIITGDESFLAPYNEALKDFPKKSQTLKDLTVDNAIQSQRLVQITQGIQQQLDLLQRRVELRRESDQQVLQRDAELPYQGKALMAQVRRQLAEFQTEEQRLLEIRQRDLENVRDLITAAVWSIGGLSILSSIIAIVMFNKIDWEIEEQNLRLQQGRSLMRSLVANIVDGVITLDQEGKIEAVNQATIEMFGYDRATLIGKPLEFLLAALPAHADQNKLHRDGIDLRTITRQQMMGCRQDGTPFPIDISISRIETSSQLLTIIRDITELKLSEANLQTRANELSRLNLLMAKTNADLQERNRELDQFAYVASHDLKAPLRAIANLSEWLEEDLKGGLPPENQRQMQLLRGRVHRMEALINGLLQYSRIGRKELPIETVRVNDLLNEVLESLDPPAAFKVEIAPNMPILKTKRLLLLQVFSNLIGNAIRHHPRPDGWVKVGVADEGDRYRFTITDDGAGIDPDFHHKIFTIFQTLEPRDTVENTGIGLAIVKKIVETEGGSIHVHSQVGDGSIFEFTWLKQSFILSG
jgi:PAS domain S-box-containing protein